MQFVLDHPRNIRSFSYNAASLILVAHHLDGASTICSDVPREMFEALANTLMPEDLFIRYIRSQFDCETVPAPPVRVH
jgi:hypothetical protein